MQDANVFVSESDAGVRHELVLAPGRQAYLVCIEGSLSVVAAGGGQAGGEAEALLGERDAAELVAAQPGKPLHVSLTAQGTGGAHLMLIEMKLER